MQWWFNTLFPLWKSGFTPLNMLRSVETIKAVWRTIMSTSVKPILSPSAPTSSRSQICATDRLVLEEGAKVRPHRRCKTRKCMKPSVGSGGSAAKLRAMKTRMSLLSLFRVHSETGFMFHWHILPEWEPLNHSKALGAVCGSRGWSGF